MNSPPLIYVSLPLSFIYLAVRDSPVVHISQPLVPHYRSERVPFGRFKTHELSTPKATVRYVTHRIPMEGFQIMVWEISAEIYFQGHPTTPGLAIFRLYREKGRFSYISSPHFVEACDTHSQGMYDLAFGMTSSFDGDIGEVFTEGSIIEFERLHVPEHLDGQRLWLEPVIALLQLLIQTYNPILFVLKPYPLEYESAGKRHPVNRIKALATLYRRTLGVRYLGKSEYMGKGLGPEVVSTKRKWFLHWGGSPYRSVRLET